MLNKDQDRHSVDIQTGDKPKKDKKKRQPEKPPLLMRSEVQILLVTCILTIPVWVIATDKIVKYQAAKKALEKQMIIGFKPPQALLDNIHKLQLEAFAFELLGTFMCLMIPITLLYAMGKDSDRSDKAHKLYVDSLKENADQAYIPSTAFLQRNDENMGETPLGLLGYAGLKDEAPRSNSSGSV